MTTQTNLVGLILEAEHKFDHGPVKKQWVIDQLGNVNGLNAELASDLIDDVVALCNSHEMSKLFMDGSRVCTIWCCRSTKK